MKFCSKCGKELFDEAVICTGCGCMTENNSTEMAKFFDASNIAENKRIESRGLSTVATVFAFLLPLVGLILGIIGASKYKTLSYKRTCKKAIIISLIIMALPLILSFFFAMLIAML